MDRKNITNILSKNKSISNLKSKFDLEYYSELPLINSKNINCLMKKNPRKKLYLKKLVFNPISYVYQKKIKLLSQVSPIAKNINKNYSIKEIAEFTKRKFFIKNYHKTIDADSIKSRNKNISKIINKNNSDISINKKNRPSLNIIDLSNNYSSKKNIDNNKVTKLEKKSINFTNRYLIDFKKSLLEIYNPKNHKEKMFQNNIRYVHNFLNKIPKNNPKLTEKDSKEIFPKYEYISYFGVDNKIITKLTSSKYDTEDEKKDNNFLKLNIESRVPPDFANYENIDDYRNKNYIKQIQLKKKKKINNKGLNSNIISLSKRSRKGYEVVFKEKNKSFEELVNNAFEQRNDITKQLANLINEDKKVYERQFELIKSEK